MKTDLSPCGHGVDGNAKNGSAEVIQAKKQKLEKSRKLFKNHGKSSG